MRDDPYYITDDHPPKPPGEDIDSIPIVRLDELLPSSSKGTVAELVQYQFLNITHSSCSRTPPFCAQKQLGTLNSSAVRGRERRRDAGGRDTYPPSVPFRAHNSTADSKLV